MAKKRNAALGTPSPPLGTGTGTTDPVGSAGVKRANACAASVKPSSKSAPNPVRFVPIRPDPSEFVRVPDR